MNNLQKTLSALMDENPDSITYSVCEEALAYWDIEGFFKDLLSHGCISGMIGSLTYYRDTHAFFDHHYYEIEDIRNKYQEEICEQIRIDSDLKNHLAWFAFEYVAYMIASDLELV